MTKKLIYIVFFLSFIVINGCTSVQLPVPLSQAPGLDPHILKLALNAYDQANCRGKVKKPYLAVVDFTKPSDEKRLWIFNMTTDQLVFYTYVAHGVNSGARYATHFSNRVNSLQSSIGVIITGKTYYGNNGYSLRLHGLEKGVNNNIYRRLIVIHGAQYVGADYARSHHRLGNTWGCFAIPEPLLKPIIDTMKGGAVLFAYYSDPNWLKHSPYLHPVKQGAICNHHS